MCAGPPVIDAANSLSLAPVSYLYGVTFTLSCNAMGNELTWLWYHNGMRLGASGSTLVVPSPTLDDSGTYQCFAYNPYSNVSAIGNITIQSELELFFLVPLNPNSNSNPNHNPNPNPLTVTLTLTLTP